MWPRTDGSGRSSSTSIARECAFAATPGRLDAAAGRLEPQHRSGAVVWRAGYLIRFGEQEQRRVLADRRGDHWLTQVSHRGCRCAVDWTLLDV
jgi:hypothetical protein